MLPTQKGVRPVPQSASWEQPGTHCGAPAVSARQTWLAGQPASGPPTPSRQRTQAPVLAQMGVAPEQSAAAHARHMPVPVLHTGRVPEHCVLAVQPTHMRVLTLQTAGAVHSLPPLPVQSTQLLTAGLVGETKQRSIAGQPRAALQTMQRPVVSQVPRLSAVLSQHHASSASVSPCTSAQVLQVPSVAQNGRAELMSQCELLVHSTQRPEELSQRVPAAQEELVQAWH
jgi:hypothetical protein